MKIDECLIYSEKNLEITNALVANIRLYLMILKYKLITEYRFR